MVLTGQNNHGWQVLSAHYVEFLEETGLFDVDLVTALFDNPGLFVVTIDPASRRRAVCGAERECRAHEDQRRPELFGGARATGPCELMPLHPGTTLGSYSVTAKIGEGGMGEVYQARDTKLDRDVALKVLPEAFTSDPDRLARFEREAKVLASLNHPNIGSIYGLEEAEGVKALVLELIEGPTLADRIAKGPIPIDEALPIAKQIAEALEAAHEQGVIHRDLKPANVKVKADGTVKVLDFGLAKAFQPEASDASASLSPTISLTAAATQMGMVIGTAAYMAPEQAKGKPVDKRADVWAFGAVLFEMLTGQRTFSGEDVTDTIAAVVRAEPDWSALPADVPAPHRPSPAGVLAEGPVRPGTRHRRRQPGDAGDVRDSR